MPPAMESQFGNSRRIRRLYVPAVTLLLVIWFSFLLVSLVRQDAGRAVHPQVTLTSLDDPPFAPPFASSLLMLGNSQTFEIPDAVAGDLDTGQWLQIFLSRRASHAVELNLGALGGMTCEEMLVRAVQWGVALDKPGQLLIAVQPSEFGQVVIRPDIAAAATSSRSPAREILSSMAQSNSDLPLGTTELRRLLALPPSEGDLNTVENRLQDRVARSLPLFAYRDDLLAIGDLLFVRERNRIFGIRTLRLTPFKPQRYQTNLEFLELILRYTESKGIATYLYLAPVRPAAESVYADSDVFAIASQVTALAGRYGAQLKNYQRIIPEQYWTYYPDNRHNRIEDIAGQPDPAHFMEPAHKILAEEIDQSWGELMIRRAGPVNRDGHAASVSGKDDGTSQRASLPVTYGPTAKQ
ncbi:MAG: hypothetical protein WCC87_19540 [Candidatus Korobacteraceae bacterium]